MGKNLIFCFSGTGNSLKAAKDIASILGDTEIVFMKNAYALIGQYDRIGFVFPSYAGGVPKVVLKYVKSLDIKADSADYVFSIVTCGGADRNTLPMLRGTLSKKGVSLKYGKALVTVGNYIAMYPIKADPEETLGKADGVILQYAREIKEKAAADAGKESFSDKLFYIAGNWYFKFKAKKLCVSDACCSCGLCEKLCPTGSIKVEEGKPVFTWKTCAQCMACVQWCPKEAINCGKETEGRVRYHHPDIKSDDLT